MKGLSHLDFVGARFGFLAAALGTALVGAPARGATTSIDFNNGSPRAAIGSFYSGLGVWFSNATWHEDLSYNQEGTPSSGVFLTDQFDTGFNPPFSPGPDTPIVLTFSQPQTSVSLLAFDVGEAGARLNAYDALTGGNLLGSDKFFGVGSGVGTFDTLSVTAPGILRVEVFQPSPSPNDGICWDNLSFTSEIPEPAPAALLGLGLCWLRLGRRSLTNSRLR